MSRKSCPSFLFFNLNAAFICLRPSIHCFSQAVLSKRSSMEGFWKARMYAAIAENQILSVALQVERSWKSNCFRLLLRIVSNLGALYEQRQRWWHYMSFFLYAFFSSDISMIGAESKKSSLMGQHDGSSSVWFMKRQRMACPSKFSYLFVMLPTSSTRPMESRTTAQNLRVH